MATKQPNFSFEREDGAAVISIEGDFTYDYIADFNRLARDLLTGAEAPKRFTIDMDRCGFVDSGCMGAMASLQSRLAAAGGSLRVINASSVVKQTMKRIRLDSIISITGKKK